MISRLALGTVQFGMAYGIANNVGQVPQAEAAAILTAARNCGLDTIDTAIAYGNSESCLGEVGVEGFHVVSKLPALPVICSDVLSWVSNEISGSLDRLKVSCLYGLLLHDPLQLIGVHGRSLIKALLKAKEDGKFNRIGYSVYSPSDLDEIYQVFRPELVQVPFNLVDRRMMASGWIQRLYDDGVEIHVRSAFLQGLLLMPVDAIPKRFKKWKPIWDRWEDWQLNHPASAISACLSYPLGFHHISRVVVGVESICQFSEIQMAILNPVALEDLPALGCLDEALINPSKWSLL